MDRPRSILLRVATASMLGGALTLSGVTAHAAPATQAQAASEFRQITLARGFEVMGEPMTLAVLPDGSVLHDSRDGTVFHTKGGQTTVAGKLDVYSHDEDGLQGMAIDPDFARNHWVYLYYAPRLDTPTTDAPANGTPEDFAPFEGHNQLSRFRFTGGELDLASEQKILQVGPISRGICCHVGGDLDFDDAGNLYLSTGDDSNPFESNGFSPIDERADRNPAFDARRTSANTNDLRGKLLRIRVKKDGTYSIPGGNLFRKGTPKTRPEIYAMGFRNPFRFHVDDRTGVVYLADYGPDAQAANPLRGPENTVEFNRITRAGNFGWPLCVGENTPYIEFDFATGASGEPFDCADPQNTSPHNTGLTDLPRAQPAWIANHYEGNPDFPELGGSGAPMGGPVYRFDPKLKSAVKFPKAYDGKFFAFEFVERWIKPITSDRRGNVREIETLTDGTDWANLVEPMDMEFGPDGSLYVLDYGTVWFGGSEDAALLKLEHVPGGTSSSAGSG